MRIRVLQNVLIFIMTAITVLAVSFWIAPRHTDENDFILGQLKSASDLDLVFVGTSYTHRQINPRQIESFNAVNRAWSGANSYKLGKTVDDLLALNHPSLDYLVIELRPSFDFMEPRRLTREDVSWHSPRQTWFALRHLVGRDLPLLNKLDAAWRHLQCAFLYLSEKNPLESVSLMTAKREILELNASQLSSGYFPNDEDELSNISVPEDFEWRVERHRRNHLDTEGGASIDIEALIDQQRRIASSGITPIYIVPPTLLDCSTQHELARQGILRHVLFFCSPDEYADLYQRRYRTDANHLNNAGAKLYTEAVEQRLLDAMTDAERFALVHSSSETEAPLPKPITAKLNQ